ncbi:uncharacterized protein BP5553_03974 [Venustampulla echinocandica]|uniref:Uncharacterized protein n=1 Tax=Venustampulla echinocandica TaxID=2656787 RepID=A0A370TVS8_9HELO|nr:uncharacterized protein BP5553_03974 [Venustampulla echinocandica]RDL39634.1 hypothetical protein BP5553_03974 [Venustampulla echinocandica]
MSGPQPPPPPPPPGRQGGPPPGAHGPPPGVMRPGPPPGHPFPPQMRPHVNSTRVVDISPQPVLDEAACKKNLTSYLVYTMRKAIPANKKEIPSWARTEVVEEKLAQGEITKQIKRLNESKKKSVAEKKAALAPFQQGQISKLMDELATKEVDPNFEWSLVQLDREERSAKQPSKKDKDSKVAKRETTTMTVYVMRTPLDGLNPIVLHQHIERMRMERFQQQNRPPPPPANQQQARPPGPPQQQQNQPQRPQQQGPQQQQNGGRGDAGGPQIINLGRTGSKSPARRRETRYHHDSSSTSSMTDSDSESGSERSSSSFTTLSTSSRGNKRYHSTKPKGSPAGHRVHHKKYYVDDRSPLAAGRRMSDLYEGGLPHRPAHAPEAPRPALEFDPVAAAYQAGKSDANAERFGLAERERFPPTPRPAVVGRPVIIEQPRAVISYGRERDFDARYPEAPMSPYSEAGFSEQAISPRYLQEKFIDGPREYRVERRDLRPEIREFRPEPREFRPELRDYRTEPRDFAPLPREFHDLRDVRGPGPDYRRREREAEEYMDRSPFLERRTTEPRPPMTRNPFAPMPPQRRYCSSEEGGW